MNPLFSLLLLSSIMTNSPDTQSWSLYDNTPEGATIHTVYDTEINDQVVHFDGLETRNGYILGNYPGKPGAWNKQGDTLIEWEMQYNEAFIIYVLVTTKNGGLSYIYYKATDESYRNTQGNIQHGLGVASTNGVWQKVRRDLNADLRAFDPENEIVSIEGIIVRGSGKLAHVATDRVPYPESRVALEAIAQNTTAPYPEYLQSVTDEAFDTQVTRITESYPKQAPYPKRQPWNHDMSLLKLDYRIYDARTYQEIPLTAGKSRSSIHNAFKGIAPHSFRWSKQRSNNFYGLNSAKKFYQGSIENGSLSLNLLRTFSDYSHLALGPGEGNIDYSDRFVALAALKSGQTSSCYAVLYDMQQDRYFEHHFDDIAWSGTNAEGDDLDWLSVSPKGNYLMVSASNRIKQYRIDWEQQTLSFVKTITQDAEHGDMGLDSEGNQVYVQFRDFDGTHGIYLYALDEDQEPIELSLGHNSYGGGHVSCQNYQRPGWCYVSTKGEGYREVFTVKLTQDDVSFERFSQTHYDSASYGGVSPNGAQVLFGSDWYGTQGYELFVAQTP